MEKFAVDLEKVLDEFEYNEEREENFSVPSVKKPSLPQMGFSIHRQVPQLARTPAASYRRPSFEPINLADANFAASPPKQQSINISHSLHDEQNQSEEQFSFFSTNSKLINRNIVPLDDTSVPPLNNDVHSYCWDNSNNVLPIDEKPDLLEYNTIHLNSHANNLENNGQLPDITTSVRSSTHGVNNNGIDHLSDSLDLISSTSENLHFDNIENNYPSQTSLIYEQNDPMDKENNSNLKSKCYDVNINPNVGSLLEKPNYISDFSSTPQSNTENSNITPLINDKVDSIKHESLSEIESFHQEDILNHNENVINNSDEGITNMLAESTSIIVTSEVSGNSDNDIIIDEELNNSKISIGFSNDTVLSENDIEEYLKELDELDETLNHNLDFPKSDTSLISKRDEDSIPRNIDSSDIGIGEIGLIDSITGKTENIIPTKSITECQSYGIENNHKLSEEDEIDAKSQCNKPFDQVSNINRSEMSSSSGKIASTTCNSPMNEKKVIKETNVIENVVFKQDRLDECSHGSNANEGEKSDYEKLNLQPSNPFDEENYENVASSEITDSKIVNTDDSIEEYSCDEVSSVESDDHLKTATVSHNTVPFPVAKNVQGNDEKSSKMQGFEKNIEYFDNDLNRSSDAAVATNDETPELDTKLITSDEVLHNSEAKCKLTESEGIEKEKMKTEDDNVLNQRLPSCSKENDAIDGEIESNAKMIQIKMSTESSVVNNIDEAGIPAEEDKPLRPNSLELPRKITVDTNTIQSPTNPGELVQELGPDDQRLGKIPPFWIPDTEAALCMQCQLKFSVIRRRHHCRACGQVLCYKCCGLKARLEYMNFAEARVCQPCFTILDAVNGAGSTSPLRRQPNPNNPMEYCSTIPPLQQVAGSLHQPPPSVMVPVGVLKREGRSKSDVTKKVMFSDGIRPGGDLTELDGSVEPRMPFRRLGRLTKRVGTPPGGAMSSSLRRVMDPNTHSFIPAEGENSLPPLVSRLQGEVSYSDMESPISLDQPIAKFALNRNLFVSVKRVLLDCCVNRECWCISSEGLACVGQDEIVVLLECLPQESFPPKDVFILINFLYQEASKGSTVSEMSFTPALSNNMLGSRDHGGFLYIRTSYQCTAHLVLPSPPYLVALLIHRWETPWARLFPIRLVLRLGAEFRYYPCPLVSVRNRPPLYTEIGHTIMNILADFRKYSYTLPSVRGLLIHMEDRQTTINIPRNRYDQVVRALNNSNDSVLAFGANMSLAADSHLVCMQTTQDENTSYHTQAINIHNKPRKVTGASFVVFNGALKVPGLAGKSNIVEDGLMVQVPSETMVAIRTALRDMRDYTIGCGPNAEETVMLQWTADDTNFNIGVKSCIDGRALDGVPSIRVHNGTDYSGGTRVIRWTEVFILQCEDSEHSSEPLDISRLSESIARATCLALVPLLDLLSAASLTTVAVRTTIHPDNVGYEAGSNGEKLPPLYMKSLDNELIAVVHQAALASQEYPAVLELVFRIMEQG